LASLQKCRLSSDRKCPCQEAQRVALCHGAVPTRVQLQFMAAIVNVKCSLDWDRPVGEGKFIYYS
jgi:hypothetical protein